MGTGGTITPLFEVQNLYPPGSLLLVNGLITSVDLRQPSINLVFSGKVIIIRKTLIRRVLLLVILTHSVLKHDGLKKEG